MMSGPAGAGSAVDAATCAALATPRASGIAAGINAASLRKLRRSVVCASSQSRGLSISNWLGAAIGELTFGVKPPHAEREAYGGGLLRGIPPVMLYSARSRCANQKSCCARKTEMRTTCFLLLLLPTALCGQDLAPWGTTHHPAEVSKR